MPVFPGITLPEWVHTEMKRLGWILIVIGLTWVAGCAGTDRELLGEPLPEPEPVQKQHTDDQAPPLEFENTEPGTNVPVDSLQMFEDLRFYGSWRELYPYGWVWRPVVVREWAPMTYGQWAWTNRGWMWISYDPFGWATDYYGYWVWDFELGWVWIPECQWEPARCNWVSWDEWVAWSPLPPPGLVYQDPWEQADNDPWVVVPVSKFKDMDASRNRVEPKYKAGYSERTLRRTPPDPEAIERSMGRPMKAIDVTLERKPVGSRQLTRVVLPPEEQAIVDQGRAQSKMKSPPTEPPTPDASKGSTDAGVKDKPSKEKSSPPTPKKESPPKFKEKVSKEKPKPEGESKKDGKDKPKG